MEWAMWSAFGAITSAGVAWITLMLMRARDSRAQVQGLIKAGRNYDDRALCKIASVAIYKGLHRNRR